MPRRHVRALHRLHPPNKRQRVRRARPHARLTHLRGPPPIRDHPLHHPPHAPTRLLHPPGIRNHPPRVPAVPAGFQPRRVDIIRAPEAADVDIPVGSRGDLEVAAIRVLVAEQHVGIRENLRVRVVCVFEEQRGGFDALEGEWEREPAGSQRGPYAHGDDERVAGEGLAGGEDDAGDCAVGGDDVGRGRGFEHEALLRRFLEEPHRELLRVHLRGVLVHQRCHRLLADPPRRV
mmetsp:Transcript_9377/g.23514  ORF Transcript_9377/g.23514 Transcript_9377/m.23514 type:complete len:233 (+) Transcript_9377:1772-2470(+)